MNDAMSAHDNPSAAIQPTNDNEAAAVTISLSDLAKGLGRDEDDLLMQLADIFGRRL